MSEQRPERDNGSLLPRLRSELYSGVQLRTLAGAVHGHPHLGV